MQKLIAFLLFFVLMNVSSAQNPLMTKLINEAEATANLEDEAAIKKLKQIQATWEKAKLPADSSYAKICHYLGRRNRFIGLNTKDQQFIKQAVFYTEKAVAVNSQKRQDISEANLTNSYLNLGLLYERELLPFNTEKALSNYEKSLTIGQKYPHKYGFAADAGGYMTDALNITGDFERAFKVITVAEKLARMSRRTDVISNCLEKKATTLRALDRMQEAEAVHKEIIRLAEIENAKTDKLGTALANLAVFYYDKKDYLNMNLYFKKSFEVFRSIDFKYGMAMVKNNEGYLKSTINKLGEAEKCYTEGLIYADNASIKTRLLDNVAILHYKQKNYDKTLSYLQEAIHTYLPQFTNYQNVTNNPSSKTIKYCAEKNYLLDLIENKGKAWLAKYKQKHNKDHLLNAQKAFLVADQMVDFMRWEHKGTQSKLFWRNKTRSIYEQAIETCYLLKDYDKAFYFFEKSRAVLLNDKLNELGARQSLSESDRAKEAQLQAKVEELRKKLESSKNDQTERELLLAENAQSDFIKKLEDTNPTYYRFKYDTTHFALNQVQKYLKAPPAPSRGAFVSYFMGDSATYALVVTPTSAKIQTLSYDPADAQTYLRLAAKNFDTKAELNAFLAVSHRLYKSLIAPLNLPKGRVIFSQDGAFLPFEALSKSATVPQYLLQDYAISYTYSAQFLLKNPSKSGIWPQKPFLGVAPVQFAQATKLNTLGGSAESIEKIGRDYFWKSTLTHQQATKSAFLTQAGGHRIVQVYTHAFADSTQTEPHIYFADSSLKVSDLEGGTFLNTHLLVLAACNTGIGKVAKGEGVLSLARGFSMAGIPATITTLWSVEDQTTYQLTELFYGFLNEGLSKDEALQKAKNQYAATHPNGSPAAWAGLVLIGDATALPSNSFWWWVLGALGLLIGLILAIGHKQS
jgi:CHAT domain-containing protein